MSHTFQYHPWCYITSYQHVSISKCSPRIIIKTMKNQSSATIGYSGHVFATLQFISLQSECWLANWWAANAFARPVRPRYLLRLTPPRVMIYDIWHLYIIYKCYLYFPVKNNTARPFRWRSWSQSIHLVIAILFLGSLCLPLKCLYHFVTECIMYNIYRIFIYHSLAKVTKHYQLCIYKVSLYIYSIEEN